MKLVLVALALVAAAAAAPAAPSSNPDANAQIVKSEFDQSPEGAYKFGYETDNGLQRNEDGELKTVNDEENKPHSVVVVRGSYTYVSPDGQPVKIEYYADETGFHAEGDSVPKQARR